MTEPRKRRLPTTAIPVNGAELRRLRKERGIEVRDLAASVGVDRTFITKLELGDPSGTPRRASASTYAALLRALEIDDHDALVAAQAVA